jgi:hypothetical protein
MKLLTIELLKTFERVGDQSQEKDPLVIAKFFHPFHHRTRYATEYDPQDRIFF